MAELVPKLPLLYEKWLSGLFDHRFPREPKATCGDCAMARAPGRFRLPDQNEFSAELKCCTFYPNLANFAVGQILADDGCGGRAEIEQRIEAGPRVSPLGVGRPPIYGLTYRESMRETFGRVPQLRCPFLTSASECAILPYREATCVTFFCKYHRGAVGQLFWQELERLLFVIERELALWCVLELDLGVAATQVTINLQETSKLTPVEIYGAEPYEHRAARWGEWAGREREFFLAAAERVAALEWQDIRRICGTALEAHTRLARAARDQLATPGLPERLRLGVFRAAKVGDGTTLLVGYSDQDGIEVADSIVALLPSFDGRLVVEVVAELTAAGATLAPELLQDLYDFGILVATAG